MTLFAKFPGTCGRCGSRFIAGTRIEWVKGGLTTHAQISGCELARERNAAIAAQEALLPVVSVDLKSVADFINAAKGRGLKFPKVTFLIGTSPVTMSVAGVKSKAPGSVQVKLNGFWIGRVLETGVVEGPMGRDSYLLTREALRTIASDPAKAAKEYAALTGNCSFCVKGLTDEGSIEVGYGPICAKRFNLPHTRKGSKTIAEQPVSSMPFADVLVNYMEQRS